MKTYIIRLLTSIAILASLHPTFVLASTFSLYPTDVNVIAGQTFSVNVAFNPQGVKNYTVKLELKYPANLFEVQSFTFASNWIPLSQAGYDLVDNAGGTLIKSAGYPAGVSSQTTFGTVTFRTKATGTGNISATTNSVAYNENSQNILTGVPTSISVAVSQPAPAPVTPKKTTNTSVSAPVTQEAKGKAIVAEEDAEDVATTSDRSLLANVGSAMTFGTGSIMAGFLFLIIMAFAGYGVYTAGYRIRTRDR